MTRLRGQITALAARNRLPAGYNNAFGGLTSSGVDLAEQLPGISSLAMRKEVVRLSTGHIANSGAYLRPIDCFSEERL